MIENNIKAAHKAGDFVALNNLYKETKDPIISLAMASLLYGAKYQYNAVEFKTKKSFDEYVRDETILALYESAKAGNLMVMREWASAQMFGRIQKGSFGSTLYHSDTKGGCITYQAIIEHPDSNDYDKAFAHYCIGHMLELITRQSPPEENREHSLYADHWVKSRALNTNSKGHWFSTMRLAEYYFINTDKPSDAISLFEEVKGHMPYAYAHLSNAYRQGKGVVVDAEKSALYFSEWETRIENYKLKCGAKTDYNIDPTLFN